MHQQETDLTTLGCLYHLERPEDLQAFDYIYWPITMYFLFCAQWNKKEKHILQQSGKIKIDRIQIQYSIEKDQSKFIRGSSRTGSGKYIAKGSFLATNFRLMPRTDYLLIRIVFFGFLCIPCIFCTFLDCAKVFDIGFLGSLICQM